MLKRIQVLEDGRVPAKKARGVGRLKGKKRITRKEYMRMGNEVETGLKAQKGLWNVAREKMLQDRGALPTEGGDIVRGYKAVHEEKILSSWLREDVEGIEERRTERGGQRRGKQHW